MLKTKNSIRKSAGPSPATHFFFKFLMSLVAIFLFIGNPQSFAQEQPETRVNVVSNTQEYHSAKKATIYSAVLPGLGQAYNKKYWKIPIIYAGFGTLIYFINFNGKEYRKFREAYNIVATGDSTNFENNEYVVKYNANLTQLQEGRNYYRRNLELNYILTGLLYILNIVDASVDANLYDFDMGDDLSLSFDPIRSQNIFLPEPNFGLTLRMKF
jgi:hypothetical protein